MLRKVTLEHQYCQTFLHVCLMTRNQILHRYGLDIARQRALQVIMALSHADCADFFFGPVLLCEPWYMMGEQML